MSLSTDESLPRFIAEPYHITLVFYVLSWRRYDALQLFTAVTVTPNPTVTSRTLDDLLRLVPSIR